MFDQKFVEDLKNKINSDKVNKLYDYLSSENSDFFIAPASSRFHHAYKGGLNVHCCQIFMNLLLLKRIPSFYLTDELLTQEVAFLLSFGHDLSKINYYVEGTKWRKDANDKWESYISYNVTDSEDKLPHETGSVYLLTKIIPEIDINIVQAIALHHGAFNQQTLREYSEASRINPFVFSLHTADMLSTIIDSKEGN